MKNIYNSIQVYSYPLNVKLIFSLKTIHIFTMMQWNPCVFNLVDVSTEKSTCTTLELSLNIMFTYFPSSSLFSGNVLVLLFLIIHKLPSTNGCFLVLSHLSILASTTMLIAEDQIIIWTLATAPILPDILQHSMSTIFILQEVCI